MTRGNLADLDGTVFWLRDGLLVGGASIERGEDLSVARELMDLEIPVSAETAGRRVGRAGRPPGAGRGAGLMTARTVRNLVDGEWVESVSGRTLERRNPADVREVVSTFPESDAKDADAAVSAVAAGWQEWADTAPSSGRRCSSRPPASWSGSGTS